MYISGDELIDIRDYTEIRRIPFRPEFKINSNLVGSHIDREVETYNLITNERRTVFVVHGESDYEVDIPKPVKRITQRQYESDEDDYEYDEIVYQRELKAYQRTKAKGVERILEVKVNGLGHLLVTTSMFNYIVDPFTSTVIESFEKNVTVYPTADGYILNDELEKLSRYIFT